jgi:hypothetical protein
MSVAKAGGGSGDGGGLQRGDGEPQQGRQGSAAGTAASGSDDSR